MTADNTKVANPSDKLREDILKPVKEFVHDPSGTGKVDLSRVQVALDVMKAAYNVIIEAAAKQITAQKLT